MKEHLKVLLVDDDPGLLDIFQEALDDLSFEVTTAKSGEEAQLKLSKEKFHCLITDISMTGMSGVELVSALRAAGNEMPVYFITGYSDYSREKLNVLRPKAIIFKPFDVEEAALLIKNHFLRS